MIKNVFHLPVEFGDTDPARIVYYPNYFRWYDCSTWRLLWKVGLSLDVLRDEFGLIGTPIVNASSTFVKPSRFGDELQITTWVGKWSRKSFEVFHEVVNGGEICARGTEIRVCAKVDDAQNMSAIAIPDDFRARLS